MTEVYEYCRFRTPAHALRQQPAHWRRMFQDRAGARGGHVYGVWASMVGLGLARDEGIAMTCWPDTEAANAAQPVADAHCHLLAATVRPDGPPPATFPGLSVFRWFEVAAEDWSAFRDLSAAAWPNMEANFEVQIHGFWRSLETSPPSSWTLLHTRYADFSVWEASRWWRQPADDAPVFSERLKARNDVIRDTIAYPLIELA